MRANEHEEEMKLSPGEAALIQAIRACEVGDVMDGTLEGEEFIAIVPVCRHSLSIHAALTQIKNEQKTKQES